MGSRRHQRHHSNGHSGSNRAACEKNNPRDLVAAAPNSQLQTIQTNELSTTSNYERRIANWTVVVGAFTVVMAIATVGSGYILWRTDNTLRETLERSQRPWIAPLSAKLLDLPIDGLIGLQINFANVGREPALDTKHASKFGVTDAPQKWKNLKI
jgi:hypothetical protein